jgi:hypothetical protein
MKNPFEEKTHSILATSQVLDQIQRIIINMKDFIVIKKSQLYNWNSLDVAVKHSYRNKLKEEFLFWLRNTIYKRCHLKYGLTANPKIDQKWPGHRGYHVVDESSFGIWHASLKPNDWSSKCKYDASCDARK